jgi:hypothetical protein
MEHIELTVDGMTCDGCSSRLKRVLADGVGRADRTPEPARGGGLRRRQDRPGRDPRGGGRRRLHRRRRLNPAVGRRTPRHRAPRACGGA